MLAWRPGVPLGGLMAMSESDSSRGKRPHRGRRLLLGLLVAVLVAGVAGSWLNSRAFGQLLTQVESGEVTMAHYNADTGRLVRDLAPSTAGQSELAAFATNYKAVAAGTLEDVLVCEQRVRDVRLWPWDRDAIRARQRYLDHLAAWERHLRAVLRAEATTANPDINATFTLVNAALADAVPLYDRDYRARLTEIAKD
jgi:hypothetical protein